MKKRLSLVIAAVAASQLGATDCGQVIEDPGFDLWCGSELCSWKLIRGDIVRVGTWHSSDSGVSFVGPDSAIQQVSPVNSFDGSCIQFTMVADVEATTEVFLKIDLESDGVVEREERIPTSSWQPITILLNIQGSYDGIRFEIAKTGNGSAVLANLGAEIAARDACQGLTAITAGPRPDGASCSQPEECGSGICTQSPTQSPGLFGLVCAGCTDTSCATGDVCGVTDAKSPTLAEPLGCIPSGSRELAESCAGDAECASGKCGPDGRCSGCKSNVECGAATCGPSWVSPLSFQPGPDVCNPGNHTGAAGAPCGSDADCASNSCTGAERKECLDGRPCQSRDDCPPDQGLTPGECTTVGIQGGTCT